MATTGKSGAIVYGLEGDFDWSNVKDTRRLARRVVTCGTSSNWLATFRGRVGYAFDRWLPYVTAGGAYGNVKATASVPILGLSASASSSQLGWTVGAGLEYAFLGNWTAKLEYLYVDLGSFNAGICAGREQRQLQGKHRSRRPELQILGADLLPVLNVRRLERQQQRAPGAKPGAFALAVARNCVAPRQHSNELGFRPAAARSATLACVRRGSTVHNYVK